MVFFSNLIYSNLIFYPFLLWDGLDGHRKFLMENEIREVLNHLCVFFMLQTTSQLGIYSFYLVAFMHITCTLIGDQGKVGCWNGGCGPFTKEKLLCLSKLILN